MRDRSRTLFLRITATLAYAGIPVARADQASRLDGAVQAPPMPTADAGGLLNEAFFLKLGFSFFVGLALGYALKIAFKIALVVGGLMLLGVLGLQYAGIADVDWAGMEYRYDGWADWLSVNGRAFLDFAGRNLSSAASFAAGLALGLKL